MFILLPTFVGYTLFRSEDQFCLVIELIASTLVFLGMLVTFWCFVVKACPLQTETTTKFRIVHPDTWRYFPDFCRKKATVFADRHVLF